jgi:hypothetical protein
MPRLLPTLILAAFAALAVPAVEAGIGQRAALADEREIAVGTELQALADVTLHRAEIAKGSRVSVTQVVRRDGRVDAVRVALADGHVVKVPVALVHASFRVVD